MVKHFEAAKEAIESTPSLVIDLPTVRRNISKLHDYVGQHPFAIRPHTKTHKSRLFARMQLEAGAQGLTVAKVGEAEVMARENNDILIAYPAIDLHRRERIARLAQGSFVRVAVDSVEHIALLAESARQAGSTVGILVDVNVGSDRTGVSSPQEALLLAQQVTRHEGALRLDGVFFYPGQIWNRPEEQPPRLKQVDAMLAEVIDLWQTAGLAAPIVSGGSTPTAYQSHFVTRQTEIRSGTYLFNDMNTVRAGFCELEECAAAIVTTVVSRAVAGKGVIDAGSKTLTSDRNVTQPHSGHGYVVEYPEATVVRLSEEHGELDLSRCSAQPKLGERLTIIPNHICPCVNLQDKVMLFDHDRELTETTIDTRGMLS